MLRKQQKSNHAHQTSTQMRINRMTTVDFDEIYNDIQKEIEEDLQIINSANEEKQNIVHKKTSKCTLLNIFSSPKSTSNNIVYKQKTKSPAIKPLISPTIIKNRKPSNHPPSYTSAIAPKVKHYRPPTHMKHINKIFSYKKQLGKGASSRVLLCTHRKNRKLYALKELTRKDKHNYYSFLKL